MKESAIVKEIKEQYTKTPFKLENKDFFSPNEDLINKAIIQLCDMWNKDEKSRGFVKHLLHSFIPIDPMSKIFNFGTDPNRRCALLGIKCASISDIADHWGHRMVDDLILRAKIDTGEVENKDEAIKVRDKDIKKMPVEVRNKTLAYMSRKSEKILSGEAIAAIQVFVDGCLWGGEKEVTYLLTKIRNSLALEEKGFSKKEVEQITRASSGDPHPCLSDETLDKLKKLKEELEEKK